MVWLYGLSGAGKSTLADSLASRLNEQGASVVRLDGDVLRASLCQDLGFSVQCRSENLRRAAHVARLLSDQGLTVVCSFVTPSEEDRASIREVVGCALVEAFVDTSLNECERRDPKGLYTKARAGKIPEFTGISAPFERPQKPDLVLRTECTSVGESVLELLDAMRRPFCEFVI